MRPPNLASVALSCMIVQASFDFLVADYPGARPLFLPDSQLATVSVGARLSIHAMDSSLEHLPSTSSHVADFRTTHWNVVLTAAQKGSPSADEALAKLCKVYWYPLYAFIRRLGHTSHEAEDLTQEFFARLLDKNFLAGIKVEGGRFRSYLLTTLKHFLANEWNRAQTQKRGGGKIFFSLDEQDAETRYEFEPTDNVTPESIFERRWALTLLEQVMNRLAEEYMAEGKAKQFERLQIFLSGDKRSIPYVQTAADLGMSEGAVKVAVHRMRKRYGGLLRAEIAQTVASQGEIEEEIRYLIAATNS